MDQNIHHLKLLSIFHYVVAALAFLFGLIPTIHLTIGTLMVSGKLGKGGDQVPLEVVGTIMIVIALAWMLSAFVFGILMIVSGRALAAQRRYTLSLVMGAIACAFVPFGTVLGVFTLLVLMKPEVRRLYGLDQASP